MKNTVYKRDFRIEYSFDAENEIQDIFKYISFNLESPENARAQIRRIIEKINSLVDMPNRYKKFDIGRWKLVNAHEVIVDNYRIIYIVNDDSKLILIMHIVYTRMNVNNL